MIVNQPCQVSLILSFEVTAINNIRQLLYCRNLKLNNCGNAAK